MVLDEMKAYEMEFLEHLNWLGMDDEFLAYVDSRVKRYNVAADAFGWACFPKLDDAGVLIDMRVLVPAIVDEETLLINVHEYVHAFDLYQVLGCVYEDCVDEREKRAKDAEHLVLERRKIKRDQ